MVILRNKEIREMSKEQLDAKMFELNRELIKYKSQVAMGTLPENPGRMRSIKKTIARIKNKKNKREVLKRNA